MGCWQPQLKHWEIEIFVYAQLYDIAAKSNLRTLMVDLKVRQLIKSQDGSVAIQFSLLLPRPFTPSANQIEDELREGIMLQPTDQSILSGQNQDPPLRVHSWIGDCWRLNPTSLRLLWSLLNYRLLSEPNPCSDPLLNHCSQFASCNRTTTNFVCSCLPGYTDVSYNKLEASAEDCKGEQFKHQTRYYNQRKNPTFFAAECTCENNGICVFDEDGNQNCRYGINTINDYHISTGYQCFFSF
jgi:hypothetical protein